MITDREQFVWVATVADAETTETTDIEVRTYWHPDRGGDASEIARAAAAMHTQETRRGQLPISAIRVGS